MIRLDDKVIEPGYFPDGTLLVKYLVSKEKEATITWLFQNNEEFLVILFLVNHLRAHGVEDIVLNMPYIPNARQDRVKRKEDIFTLKYFAKAINDLQFKKVCVLDPHSYVSEALIDRICVESPKSYINKALKSIGKEDVMLFFPDEGAMKRYADMFDRPYAFGIKKRDWETGVIKGLEVSGQTDRIKDSTILIIDDICSRGGTFYHSAKTLKEIGAKDIYLYVSHCENTIHKGELLKEPLIEKIFTTDSIFTELHERVEVYSYEPDKSHVVD